MVVSFFLTHKEGCLFYDKYRAELLHHLAPKAGRYLSVGYVPGEGKGLGIRKFLFIFSPVLRAMKVRVLHIFFLALEEEALKNHSSSARF